MSDQTKETNGEREKFRIKIDQHAPFDGVADLAYVTTNEFLAMTSDVFRDVFADYEGCILETGQNGEPVVSLLFNHGKYGEKDAVCVERAGGKATGSSIIDRTRNRDRQLTEGDRYIITEDGKDAIMPLLTAKCYNNGNPNWKVIVGEFQDRNVYNYYQPTQLPQYTKIYGISLNRLCGLLFGEKDGDEFVEYSVNIATSIMPKMTANMSMNPSYLLAVTKVSQKEIKKIYEKLGFGNIGTQIVR